MNWTVEEKEYIQENWGKFSLKTLARNLKRSESGVRQKVYKMGLGSFLEQGDYVSWNQFLIALGVQGGYSYKEISWVQNRGFPLRTKKVNDCSFKVVFIDEFWKWAEKNRMFLDFCNFEENSLGEEPAWAKEKRRKDYERNRKFTKSPWTKQEDNKLRKLLKDYKYSYQDLSRMLRRTNGAIQRRICELNLMERPIKADNHVKWTEREYKLLWELIDKGNDYCFLSDQIGKSEKAIRGRVYSYYGTENLDKVREQREKVS